MLSSASMKKDPTVHSRPGVDAQLAGAGEMEVQWMLIRSPAKAQEFLRTTVRVQRFPLGDIRIDLSIMALYNFA